MTSNGSEHINVFRDSSIIGAEILMMGMYGKIIEEKKNFGERYCRIRNK